MGDCISRDAAISKIRDEGVLGGDYDAYEREEDVVNTLNSVPAADVVEVVRCRECKYTEIWGGRLECHMHHDRIVHAEEYCAWGKRKDGGQHE